VVFAGSYHVGDVGLAVVWSVAGWRLEYGYQGAKPNEEGLVDYGPGRRSRGIVVVILMSTDWAKFDWHLV
jgi:hypothetical protein